MVVCLSLLHQQLDVDAIYSNSLSLLLGQYREKRVFCSPSFEKLRARTLV